MGYFQMKAGRGNTKAGCRDPRYIEVFDWLRDLGYTVRQARVCADETIELMNKNPGWSVRQALQEVLK